MESTTDQQSAPQATPSPSPAPRVLRAWQSPWVLAWVGLVVVVLGVNITMVYLAITTSPGLVVDDYYDRGQHYEQTLVSKAARDPGWLMRADVPWEIKAGQPAALRLFVVDKAGQPVAVEGAKLHVYRPSDATRDFSVPMTEEGAGRFVAQVSFPLVGVWDTLIAVGSGEDEHTLGRRVMVAKP